MKKYLINLTVVILIILLAAAAAVYSSSTKSEKKTEKAPKLPKMIEAGSTYCNQCKEMAEIIKKLEVKYKGKVVFEKVDVNKDPRKAQDLRIQMIPTQIFLDKDGKEVWRHIGLLEQPKVEEQLKKMGVK